VPSKAGKKLFYKKLAVSRMRPLYRFAYRTALDADILSSRLQHSYAHFAGVFRVDVY